jgi:hypothetical protein
LFLLRLTLGCSQVYHESAWWFGRKFGGSQELSRLSIGTFVADILHGLEVRLPSTCPFITTSSCCAFCATYGSEWLT